MPWVRIDENVPDHPKFIAISANAFRLWVEGVAYCQKHLTDGVIPRFALKKMRYYSAASMKDLTAVLAPGKGPLWHVIDTGDIRVHDYLDHNDSREVVLKKRGEARNRMRGKRSHERSREHSTEHTSERSCEQLANAPAREQTANSLRGVVGSSRELPGRERGLGETITESDDRSAEQRAGEFCEWYADQHAVIFGHGYIPHPRNDYERAIALCRAFSDADLHDATIIWFGMTDEFATKGNRSIPKFASRVSECVRRARKVTA